MSVLGKLKEVFHIHTHDWNHISHWCMIDGNLVMSRKYVCSCGDTQKYQYLLLATADNLAEAQRNSNMLNNKSTTYIFLERGLEDIQIIDEINKVHSMLGIGPRDFHFNFPKLSQLRQELENEYDKSNCDQ